MFAKLFFLFTAVVCGVFAFLSFYSMGYVTDEFMIFQLTLMAFIGVMGMSVSLGMYLIKR